MYVGGWHHNFLKYWRLFISTDKKSASRFLQLFDWEKKFIPALLGTVREDSFHLWLCTEEGLVSYNEQQVSSNIFLSANGEGNNSPTPHFISNIFIDSMEGIETFHGAMAYGK